MMKKIALFCLCLFCFQTLDAKTVSLYTGRWFIDRYRNVDVDQFDYLYQILNIDQGQGTLQLADGSIWRVEPMYDETSSFYAQQYPFDANTPVDAVFAAWQPGDVLIYHKVVNRDTFWRIIFQKIFS